ncbi:MAG: hypothetical protein ACKO1Y_06410 [Actinomycetota bacterium]
MPRIAAALWTISPALIAAIDEGLGPPVDAYVNGAQTWFVDTADEVTLEFRLHPAARYTLPAGCSHHEILETVTDLLGAGSDPHALRLGSDVRPLSACWDGLECYAAYDDALEPADLVTRARAVLGREPDRSGMVDHDAVADAWEQARGDASIVALLLEQLSG